MQVIFDHNQSKKKLRRILKSSGQMVDLESIVLVGDEPDANTITTLPSTFPRGDFRYKVCSLVKREKQAGKTVTQICRDHPGLKIGEVRNYFYKTNARSANSVEAAIEQGILPFSYNNPNIDSLNTLFALAFWTGCVSHSSVDVHPSEYNKPVLERLVNSLGYTLVNSDERGIQQPGYTVEKDAYRLISSALARIFGLLGIPFQQGNKLQIKEFEIPWYAQFMQAGLFGKRQDFNKASQARVNAFCRIFCYALLSDKTCNAKMREGVGIDLMTTSTMKTGKKLTTDVANMLMQAFPSLSIPDNHRMTTRKNDYSFKNRIYLYSTDMPIIIGYLRVVLVFD
ncbi:hypothetical protein HYU06_00255 [Candidatus Woesearchaeota archaeon]|nr:hypothetical protein [Candidatus Woesearchaeota archaeon]